MPLPVKPHKRCLYLMDVRAGSADAEAFFNSGPFVIDPTGVFARPDSAGGFVAASFFLNRFRKF